MLCLWSTTWIYRQTNPLFCQMKRQSQHSSTVRRGLFFVRFTLATQPCILFQATGNSYCKHSLTEAVIRCALLQTSHEESTMQKASRCASDGALCLLRASVTAVEIPDIYLTLHGNISLSLQRCGVSLFLVFSHCNYLWPRSVYMQRQRVFIASWCCISLRGHRSHHLQQQWLWEQIKDEVRPPVAAELFVADWAFERWDGWKEGGEQRSLGRQLSSVKRVTCLQSGSLVLFCVKVESVIENSWPLKLLRKHGVYKKRYVLF